MIKKDSLIPLHKQVKDYILKQIKSGVFQTGDMLPPELSLAETLGVSRNTIRQALLALVNDSVLFRERGCGTFVAEKPMHRGVPALTGFHEYVKGLGKKPSSRYELIELTIATPQIRHMLRTKGKEQVVHLHRLVSIDGKRAGVHEIYLPHILWRKIDATMDEMKNTSLYALLETNCDIDLTYGDESIYVREATDQECSELSLPKGSMVFVVSRLLYDQNDNPVCYADNIYHPKRFKYYIKYKKPE